jgi:hypothetical protein
VLPRRGPVKVIRHSGARRPQHTSSFSVYPGKLCQKSPRGDRRTAALPFPRAERGAAATRGPAEPGCCWRFGKLCPRGSVKFGGLMPPASAMPARQRVKQAQASTVRFRGFGRFLLSTCVVPRWFLRCGLWTRKKLSHRIIQGGKSLTAWTREKGRDRLLSVKCYFPSRSS